MSTLIQEKASSIRNVIRYIKRFKDAIIIIHLDDELIDSPLFKSHIRDIRYIHEAGLRVIIIPGAKKRIDEVLSTAGISWTYHNGIRITNPEAMPLIKMAAFDVSNKVMTALAGEKETAVIGNWVRARGKGVIDGIDYQTSGEIDKLQEDSIYTVLNNGFIPIFPSIGWSITGKPYNISSTLLAKQIATHLKADKLFFLLPNGELSAANFTIPDTIGLSPEGKIPALNLDELTLFMNANLVDAGDNSSPVDYGAAGYRIYTSPNNCGTALDDDGNCSSPVQSGLTTERSVVSSSQEYCNEDKDNSSSKQSGATNERSVVYSEKAGNPSSEKSGGSSSGYSFRNENEDISSSKQYAVTNERSVVFSEKARNSSSGYSARIENESVSSSRQYGVTTEKQKEYYETNNQSVVSSSSEHSALNENIDTSSEQYTVTNERSVVSSTNPAEYPETNERSVVNVSREKIFDLLSISKEACLSGVSRVHILNGLQEGVLPCEIFSDLGSGTMIYSNGYGKIRDMESYDIPTVLSIMKPFIEKGNLLPRNEQILSNTFSDYIVYELDGGVHACAALHSYSDNQMEIAALAVDETCAHIGIGDKLIKFLVARAQQRNAKSIFILTTQTADWFEKIGFIPDEISTLPEERKKLWSSKRGSKLMRLSL